MGEEVPEYPLDSAELFSVFGHDSEAQGYKTTTIIGAKIYVVEGSEDSDDLGMSVKTFDKLTGKWSVPTVLGTKPISSKGHSAVLLNENRILILKRESSPGDSIWLLEVDTAFVKEQKKSLGTEVVAWSKAATGDSPMPIVISGPSGVGKGTLISKLMKEFPSTFGFSVSHTTRAPREKEVNGVHYHFTERGVMEKDIKEGKFLESASVHGNLYGTSIAAVEVVADNGKRCILDIDVQGARSVRACSLEAIFIFIVPPSFDELEMRLRSRGTETEEQVEKRLRNAKAELEQGKSPGVFDHILVNDDLEACYQNLKKLLALDRAPDASYQQDAAANLKFSIRHFISKKDQKILINYGNINLETSSPSMFVLDVSSLQGGAPGQTRGLHVSAISSLTETLNGFERL